MLNQTRKYSDHAQNAMLHVLSITISTSRDTYLENSFMMYCDNNITKNDY